MKIKLKKCCICGKEIKGWGNNPEGALNKKGEVINWSDEDECCDDCNATYVIAGRIAQAYNASPNDAVKIMPDRLVNR